MKIAVIALLALLSGCVTTEPRSIGRDTYRVETMGTNMTFDPALRTASSFCSTQGKKVQVLTTNKAGAVFSANTSVTFMCLDENDPRYRSQDGASTKTEP